MKILNICFQSIMNFIYRFWFDSVNVIEGILNAPSSLYTGVFYYSLRNSCWSSSA